MVQGNLRTVRSVVFKSCGPSFFFKTRTMVEVLKQAGACHVSSELLKISVNTAQCFRLKGETESGPVALC